jgi:hypothetical protein
MIKASVLLVEIRYIETVRCGCRLKHIGKKSKYIIETKEQMDTGRAG